MENHRYRGYQIETPREWSKWCVSVYPTRPDPPIAAINFAHLDAVKGRRGDRGQAKHRSNPVKPRQTVQLAHFTSADVDRVDSHAD